eukprot:RCo042578
MTDAVRELSDVLAIEGKVVEQQHEGGHPEGPHVDGLPVQGGAVRALSAGQLWGKESRSAPHAPAGVLLQRGHPEVSNFHHPIAGHQQILRLDVPVDEPGVVQVLQAGNNLPQELCNLLSRERPIFQGAVEVKLRQGSLLDVVDDKVELLRGHVINDLVQANQVGVPELLHDGHLAHQKVLVAPAGALQEAAVDHLDREQPLGVVVHHQLHLAIAPTPQSTQDGVLVDRLVAVRVGAQHYTPRVPHPVFHHVSRNRRGEGLLKRLLPHRHPRIGDAAQHRVSRARLLLAHPEKVVDVQEPRRGAGALGDDPGSRPGASSPRSTHRREHRAPNRDVLHGRRSQPCSVAHVRGGVHEELGHNVLCCSGVLGGRRRRRRRGGGRRGSSEAEEAPPLGRR